MFRTPIFCESNFDSLSLLGLFLVTIKCEDAPQLQENAKKDASSPLCRWFQVHHSVRRSDGAITISYTYIWICFITVTISGRKSKTITNLVSFFPKIGKTQMRQLKHTLKLKYTLRYHYSLKNYCWLTDKRSLCASPVKDVNLINTVGRLLILN